MPIILDIYFENPREGEDDFYLPRQWNMVPERGDTIVYQGATPDGDTAVWEGEVVKRLFCTDDDGALRVQLHCEQPVLTDVMKEPAVAKEPEAPETL